MKKITEINLENFEAWSGAKDTKQAIINNNTTEEFENLINELHPEGLTETELNDILWFEDQMFVDYGILPKDDDNE